MRVYFKARSVFVRAYIRKRSMNPVLESEAVL